MLDGFRMTKIFGKVAAVKVKKAYHTRLKQLWKGAIRAMLTTMAAQMAVDSGMSVASLLPLGAEVRVRKKIERYLSGAVGTGRPYNATSPFPDTSLKSKTAGERLGYGAYELSFGSARNPKFSLEFKIVILQFFLHDNGLGKGSKKRAWKALAAGEEAFHFYIDQKFDHFINDDIFYAAVDGTLNFETISELL